MNMKIKVYPGEGKLVRDPMTYLEMPKEGWEVDKNAYWMRRLLDGDVVLKAKHESKPVSQEIKKSKEIKKES